MFQLTNNKNWKELESIVFDKNNDSIQATIV
jgi:hypothetical protein